MIHRKGSEYDAHVNPTWKPAYPERASRDSPVSAAPSTLVTQPSVAEVKHQTIRAAHILRIALAREAAVRWPYVAIVIASGRRHPSKGELPEGAHFIGKPFTAETVHGYLRDMIPDHRKPASL